MLLHRNLAEIDSGSGCSRLACAQGPPSDRPSSATGSIRLVANDAALADVDWAGLHHGLAEACFSLKVRCPSLQQLQHKDPAAGEAFYAPRSYNHLQTTCSSLRPRTGTAWERRHSTAFTMSLKAWPEAQDVILMAARLHKGRALHRHWVRVSVESDHPVQPRRLGPGCTAIQAIFACGSISTAREPPTPYNGRNSRCLHF